MPSQGHDEGIGPESDQARQGWVKLEAREEVSSQAAGGGAGKEKGVLEVGAMAAGHMEDTEVVGVGTLLVEETW